MAAYTEEKKLTVWKKGRLIDKATFLNPKVQSSSDEFRLDESGAIIQFSQFGEQTEYGWTIDHVLPVSKGGTDDIRNLDPSHWKNNQAKGDDFPSYFVAIGVRNNETFENEVYDRLRPTFTPSMIARLLEVYPNNQHLLNCPEVYENNMAIGGADGIGIVPNT